MNNAKTQQGLFGAKWQKIIFKALFYHLYSCLQKNVYDGNRANKMDIRSLSIGTDILNRFVWNKD